MADLRCDTCKHQVSGFCVKLKEGLPNDLAKLFYGGAVSIYSGNLTYLGECGIEKEHEPETEVEIGTLVPEILSQEDGNCQQ
jgi:hypothetical protein